MVLLSLTCSLTLVSISTSQAALAPVDDKKQPVEAPKTNDETSKASDETSEVNSYIAIAGSGFSSLIYTPMKFVSALLMGIGGGLSLIGTVPTGTEKNSIDIVKLGMSGDWWITPDHIRGTSPFNFIKPTQ